MISFLTEPGNEFFPVHGWSLKGLSELTRNSIDTGKVNVAGD